MTGETREKVMSDLEVQTPVDEAQGRGANHVGCGAQLTVHERFVGTEIGRGH